MVIVVVRKKIKGKGVTSKAKKKEAVARAVIKKIDGEKSVVRINGRNIRTIEPRFVFEYLMEPLEIAGPIGEGVSISVNVRGGGFMGQMVASRAAIAKALVEFSGDEALKKKMIAYDRMLLVDDVRRVEPKKPLGKKARRKKQLSKR